MIINQQSIDTESLDRERTWISLRVGNKTDFISGLEVGATGSSGGEEGNKIEKERNEERDS